MLVHFIANFPNQLFELKLDIDMETLFKEKRANKLIIYKQLNNHQKTMLTITGHSVLVVCMRNEK